jgi:hypothetical protein
VRVARYEWGGRSATNPNRVHVQNLTNGARMKIARTVAEALDQHVTLEVECIDRMYLNVYMPQLQHVGGEVQYIRYHLKQPWASTALFKTP